MRNNSFSFADAKDEQDRKSRHKKEIYSYKISSVPLRKKENLKIQAVKKILSPIPSKQLPKLAYIYTPTNKDFSYSRPKKIFGHKFNDLLVNNCISLPKARWIDKHYSCFEKYHPRSKSIQENYKKSSFPQRRISIFTAHEIPM